MKRFLPWVAGALVLSACDKANAPVAPTIDGPSLAVTRFIDQDFRGEFPATLVACNGDLVALIIQFSGHINGQINGGNRLHFEAHETFTGQGTGAPSGLKYNFNQTVNEVEDFDATDFASATLTSVVNFHLNAQGSADDLRGHFLFHLTINANGEVTSVVDNFVFECK